MSNYLIVLIPPNFFWYLRRHYYSPISQGLGNTAAPYWWIIALNIYSHALKSRDQDAAEKLDAVLNF